MAGVLLICSLTIKHPLLLYGEIMIIIIDKADMSLPDFPFDFFEHTKAHCKIVAVQDFEDETNSKFHITRSIYHDANNKTITKEELINWIEKAL